MLLGSISAILLGMGVVLGDLTRVVALTNASALLSRERKSWRENIVAHSQTQTHTCFAFAECECSRLLHPSLAACSQPRESGEKVPGGGEGVQKEDTKARIFNTASFWRGVCEVERKILIFVFVLAFKEQ